MIQGHRGGLLEECLLIQRFGLWLAPSPRMAANGLHLQNWGVGVGTGTLLRYQAINAAVLV